MDETIFLSATILPSNCFQLSIQSICLDIFLTYIFERKNESNNNAELEEISNLRQEQKHK